MAMGYGSSRSGHKSHGLFFKKSGKESAEPGKGRVHFLSKLIKNNGSQGKKDLPNRGVNQQLQDFPEDNMLTGA